MPPTRMLAHHKGIRDDPHRATRNANTSFLNDEGKKRRNNIIMDINARSAGPPSFFLLASRSPVSCNSEKTRFSDAPHAPASRRPRCRCRSRWLRESVPQLRSSRALWPGLERRADKPPLKTSAGSFPKAARKTRTAASSSVPGALTRGAPAPGPWQGSSTRVRAAACRFFCRAVRS